MTKPRNAPASISKGIILVMTSVIFFSVGDLLAKQLTRHYPIALIVWARFTFHLLFVLVALGPRYRLSLFRTRHPFVQFMRGFLLLLGSVFFVSALKYMPLAESTAIAYLAPILATLLSVLFLGEKVDRGRWIAIFCSFAGVLTIIRPGGALFTWAVLLPIGNAFAFASYQILTRRLAGLESPYTSIFYAGLVGSLLSLVTLPEVWTLPKEPWHVVLFLAIGILGSSGHLILIKAYEHAPISRLAPFSYSQLIWVAAIGYFVFGDFPDIWSLTGIGILLCSGIYIARRQRLAAETTPP